LIYSAYGQINKTNFSNIPEENTDELESDMNYFSKPKQNKAKKKTNRKSKGEKNIKNFKKIHFTNFKEIWDIVLDNVIVAFCGKNYIKVLFFKPGQSKPKNASICYSTPNSESQIENININEITASQKSFNLSDINGNNNTFKNLTETFNKNLNPNLNENANSNKNISSNQNYNKQVSKVSNKSQNELFEEEITFSDQNEEYYCLALSSLEIQGESRKILAAGGTKSIIKILDLIGKQEYMSLIGHRNEIYDLKFHPKQSNILLSASKDYSVRIWNVRNGLQIAILAGPKGHSAEVLAVDWHLSGDYLVSSSIDNTVKIWEITAEIKEKIEQSNKIVLNNNKLNKDNLSENKEEQPIGIIFSSNVDVNPNLSAINNNFQNDKNAHLIYEEENFNKPNLPSKKSKNKFKTLITTIPMFSCKTIHENYVDSVKFNGNFIISKSIDGVVKEWLPIFNKESDYHLIVNCYTYEIKELVWYMKLGFDPDSKIFATGNTQGKLFVFKLNEELEEETIDDEFDYYYNNTYNQTIDTGCNKLIRSVAVFENKVVFGNCDGNVFFAEINVD